MTDAVRSKDLDAILQPKTQRSVAAHVQAVAGADVVGLVAAMSRIASAGVVRSVIKSGGMIESPTSRVASRMFRPFLPLAAE